MKLENKPNSILSALEGVSAQGVVPMHMPGHKRNGDLSPYLKALGATLDITEIQDCDCLHHPEGIILDAMNLAKSLFRSEHSYLLVNGSTCGILAAIHAVTRSGDRVLMARACHKSVYNGVALCGLQVDYLLQTQRPEGYYAPVTANQVADGLKKHPETKLVVITSPTYEGYLSDVKQIAEICHQNQVILLVDEAHGAHLGFCDYFAGSAVQAGADIVVQSLHKTLPSLTQTAIAHVQGDLVAPGQLAASLGIFETSSPSYLLMASIDGCLHLLAEQGGNLFAQWQKNLENFYQKSSNLKYLDIILETSQIKDPSKIIISTQNTNLDGVALKIRLREEFGIELEMAYGDYALAMTGMGDVDENFDRLFDALCAIDVGLSPAPAQLAYKPYGLTELPAVAMPLCQTHNLPRKNSDFILEGSIGEICGSYLWAYPPGVPIITPGEVISKEILDLLTGLEASGVDIQDTSGGWPEKIATISY